MSTQEIPVGAYMVNGDGEFKTLDIKTIRIAQIPDGTSTDDAARIIKNCLPKSVKWVSIPAGVMLDHRTLTYREIHPITRC
jgi:hypothetical protein